MTAEIGIVKFRPRNKRVEPPLLLGAFRIRVQDYLTTLRKGQDSLWEASDLFGKGNDIWQDQCEHLITEIRTISGSVGRFCQLLDTSAQLPEAAIPFRYPLVVALHRTREQVGDLIQLITQFRAVCRTSSTHIIEQRYTIADRLEELVQSLDTVQQKAQTLLDQVDQMRFPKRKLAYL